MPPSTLPVWADELAEAFKSAGPNVDEKVMFGGRAFLVDGRLMGHVELRANALRVRFRLAEPQRHALEARAHYDPASPLPALLVVTEDDRDFARSLVRHAYRFARSERRRPARRR